jgi:glutaryl-CoA dehydrogenase
VTPTIPASDSRSASDLMNLDDEFSAAELELRAAVREFVDRRIRPGIADWFDRAVFPVELVPEMAELGLLGMHLEGYGCAGRSAVEYGIAMQELEAGDSGIRTFVSVQGSLAMTAIHRFRGAEGRVAAADGARRGDRMLRADRARGRIRPVEHGDRGPPRGR